MITKSSPLVALGNVTRPQTNSPEKTYRVITRIGRAVGRTISSVAFNMTTLQSERDAIAAARDQVFSTSEDTRTLDERISAYLDAPMRADGTHPDPLAPEFNLFGE